MPEAERGLAAEAAEGRPGPGPDPAGAAAGQQPPGGPRDRRPRRAEATEAPTPHSRSGVIRRGTKLDLQASDHGGLLTRETSRPHPPLRRATGASCHQTLGFGRHRDGCSRRRRRRPPPPTRDGAFPEPRGRPRLLPGDTPAGPAGGCGRQKTPLPLTA